MPLFVSALCLLCTLSLVSPDAMAADTSPQRIKVTPETHELSVTPAGLHYQLVVSLPTDYGRDIGKQYPVVYVVDGQALFPDVVGHYLNLRYQQQIPELIVVGINWVADAETMAWLADGEQPDFNAERQRDLSPYPTANQHDSGRAVQFLNTLRNQIVPFIETQYRAAPGERALVGTELGGLFSYYALFQSGSLFNRYLIVEPTLINGELALTLEGQYAGQSTDLPARVFLAGQPGSGAQLRQQISSKLEQRHYPRLTFQTRISPSQADALRQGMHYLFDTAGAGQ